MPLRSGRVLLLPRNDIATIPVAKKPKKRGKGESEAVKPATPDPVVGLPSSPEVGPPAAVLVPFLPTATAEVPAQEENILPKVAPKRFKRLNAKVTKTWLLEMFELDASTDVDRDGAVDCLFRHWLRENVEEQVEDEWTKKSLHSLATSVGLNLRLVYAQAADLAGISLPVISGNGRGDENKIRRVRPTEKATRIMEEHYPDQSFLIERFG